MNLLYKKNGYMPLDSKEINQEIYEEVNEEIIAKQSLIINNNNFNNNEISIDLNLNKQQLQPSPLYEIIIKPIKKTRFCINITNYETYYYNSQIPVELSHLFNVGEYKSIIDNINSIYKKRKLSTIKFWLIFIFFIIYTIITSTITISLLISNNGLIYKIIISFIIFASIISFFYWVTLCSKKSNTKKFEDNIRQIINKINNNLFNRGIIFNFYFNFNSKPIIEQISVSFSITPQQKLQQSNQTSSNFSYPGNNLSYI
ncbi:hypothetical protein DICPUDRAFT_77189 [Dictyostelium purpureum]|uniref:Transmembrane protein n=1 Tax=Dictyostelium purpureum TaxID=5786 RepID=F0ZFV7_DICPU|nr:uncharacterized protein DICPUDRAFT_77189 [Dictyostelium purpureum]EGC37161.1 hypothetical protein DICPUDRAFT_77189 [Dictyostelium purpureum]|eukprot:XP_003286289.1 hypothetical protein DICPUDRAFT_77189 [Dictyostelium purpureum]